MEGVRSDKRRTPFVMFRSAWLTNDLKRGNPMIQIQNRTSNNQGLTRALPHGRNLSALLSNQSEGRRAFVAVGLTALAASCIAQSAPATIPATNVEPPVKEKNYLIGGQITIIPQTLLPFHSPYAGRNSLVDPSTPATDWTDTYTLFLGYRPVKSLEFYVDPEMARGAGVGGAVGLGGYPNGDVLRVPGFGIGALPQSPYLARYFARWTFATGSGTTKLAAGENQIGGDAPANRIVVSAGKLPVTDIFDTNTYSNSTRTQFMNWALINNAAFDYAADTRGYSDGAAIEWIHPTWALRVGSFEMPVIPNGPLLATHWDVDQGDELEAEVHPQLVKGKDPAVVRMLAYRNIAHMGNYQEAIQIGQQTGTPPDITATEKNGAIKYGFGLNMEQAMGDDGDTGLFARLGWDDGRTESFAYTECDDQVSLGAQISGKRWKSPQEHLGIALLSDGLSAAHRDYLAAGGNGFLLGDGQLNYGREMIMETYWQRQITKQVAFTLDYQFIANPGYNQDRGPVSIITARVHFEF